MKIWLISILFSGWALAQHHPPSFTDTRKPVQLLDFMAEHQKKNMREHLEAIRDIMQATTESDFAKVAEAAKKLGSSPQMNMMCNHMGQATPGFTPMALKMHTEADKILVAANKKDLKTVMSATANTLQACTNCHAAYKQQIVSEDQWNKLIKKSN